MFTRSIICSYAVRVRSSKFFVFSGALHVASSDGITSDTSGLIIVRLSGAMK